MSYLPFICITMISVLLVFPGFEIVQHISIRKGQIPKNGIREWFGKKFFHWNDYFTQKYGDLIFLSLFNGFTAQLLYSKEVLHSYIYTSILIGAIITYLWYRRMINVFKDKNASDWNWGFTYPNGVLTFAGKYHLLYFFLEATIVAFTLIYIFPKEGLTNKLLLIFPLLGYTITLILDNKSKRIHF